MLNFIAASSCSLSVRSQVGSAFASKPAALGHAGPRKRRCSALLLWATQASARFALPWLRLCKGRALDQLPRSSNGQRLASICLRIFFILPWASMTTGNIFPGALNKWKLGFAPISIPSIPSITASAASAASTLQAHKAKKASPKTHPRR